MSIRKIFLWILVIHLYCGCRTLNHHPTIAYDGVRSEIVITNDGQTAHVATIDLRLAQLSIVKPADKKLMTTTEQSKKFDAAVAINGGFFGHDGAAVGALKINGQWISKPHRQKYRGVIGFNDQGHIIFDRLIYKDGVISNGEHQFASSNWWDGVENILGGAPLLLHEGKKVDPTAEETLSTFLTERYARTAICACDKNIAKLVVVDGGDRKANLVVKPSGMSINELAEFLLSLGCKDALNLDGGYSSTYVVGGKKINQFSIASMPQREVSTVLLVRPREQTIH